MSVAIQELPLNLAYHDSEPLGLQQHGKMVVKSFREMVDIFNSLKTEEREVNLLRPSFSLHEGSVASQIFATTAEMAKELVALHVVEYPSPGQTARERDIESWGQTAFDAAKIAHWAEGKGIYIIGLASLATITTILTLTAIDSEKNQANSSNQSQIICAGGCNGDCEAVLKPDFNVEANCILKTNGVRDCFNWQESGQMLPANNYADSSPAMEVVGFCSDRQVNGGE